MYKFIVRILTIGVGIGNDQQLHYAGSPPRLLGIAPLDLL